MCCFLIALVRRNCTNHTCCSLEIGCMAWSDRRSGPHPRRPCIWERKQCGRFCTPTSRYAEQSSPRSDLQCRVGIVFLVRTAGDRKFVSLVGVLYVASVNSEQSVWVDIKPSLSYIVQGRQLQHKSGISRVCHETLHDVHFALVNGHDIKRFHSC